MTVKYKTGGILVYEWQVDFCTHARMRQLHWTDALLVSVVQKVDDVIQW